MPTIEDTEHNLETMKMCRILRNTKKIVPQGREEGSLKKSNDQALLAQLQQLLANKGCLFVHLRKS